MKKDKIIAVAVLLSGLALAIVLDLHPSFTRYRYTVRGVSLAMVVGSVAYFYGKQTKNK